MEHLNSYADDRLVVGCIYCHGDTDTREHVPSRILLDEPYPENLPVLPACAKCNQGFSLDEEYFACLIECARTGSIDKVERPKIRRILQDSPALAAHIMQARTVADNGEVVFKTENDRVRSVVVKLARGHAVYELDEQKPEEPSHVMIAPLHTLDTRAREHFENPPTPSAWPEVGTRALQRVAISMVGTPAALDSDWIDVQEGQYRYFAIAEDAVMVRFVVGEYLACEVIWGLDDH
jgi:hypothetical protein